jgi:hypothetical protein
LAILEISDQLNLFSPRAFRRVTTTADFWCVCENYLTHDEPMTLEPVSTSEAPLDLPAAF